MDWSFLELAAQELAKNSPYILMIIIFMIGFLWVYNSSLKTLRDGFNETIITIKDAHKDAVEQTRETMKELAKIRYD